MEGSIVGMERHRHVDLAIRLGRRNPNAYFNAEQSRDQVRRQG
jgi:hypothetical protein